MTVTHENKNMSNIDRVKQGVSFGLAAVEADALSIALRAGAERAGVHAPDFFDSEFGQEISPLLAAYMVEIIANTDKLSSMLPDETMSIAMKESQKAIVGTSTILTHKYLAPFAEAFTSSLVTSTEKITEKK